MLAMNFDSLKLWGTQHIGDVVIPIEEVLNGGFIDGSFDVPDSQKK
jgi:hypothetical protein